MAAIKASGASLEQAAAAMIAEERTSYRTIYRGYAGNFLAVSPAYGRFLYMMTRLQGHADRRVQHLHGGLDDLPRCRTP